MEHTDAPCILICDDEPDIVKALEIYLQREGYSTCAAYDGKQALDVLAQREIQLVVLDCMMPRMDGITTLRFIREQSNVPVIFLTAKTEESDIITGLDMGADDYITKPFRPAELIARIRSQLRRYTMLGGVPEEENNEGTTYTVGDITLDHRARRVSLGGEEVALTPREYDILYFLMRHPGEVFSPVDLYTKVWQDMPLGAEGTVAVHIRHLREKLELDPASPRWLKVVWGQGYKLEDDRSGAKKSEKGAH
ncbi:MAG: response regulator transcription factor [Clostridia bacterium]|nr:response regulator transcription factor [Clostridia bacterium]